MDESGSSSCSILNRQSARIWAYRNPQAVMLKVSIKDDYWRSYYRPYLSAYIVAYICIRNKCEVFAIFMFTSPKQITRDPTAEYKRTANKVSLRIIITSTFFSDRRDICDP